MGKRVKDEFGFVPDDQEVIQPPNDNFGFVPDEPVKKKDDPAPAIPSAGPSASEEHGEPSGTPTVRPTPTTRLKERVGNFVTASKNSFAEETQKKRAELQAIVDADPSKEEQVNQDFQKFLTERQQAIDTDMDKWMGIYSDQFTKEDAEFQKQLAEEDFQKNKVTNPLKSLAKTAWTTFSDDLPSQAFASRALMTRLGAKIDDFGNEQLERLGVNDFLESAGLLKPVSKEVKQQATNHIMLSDLRAAVENSKASAEAKKYLVNSLDKVKGGDFVDMMNYAASAIGQGVAQIPLSVATRGLSSVVQQTGSIYLESVQQIARENNMTVEEVIKSEKDTVLYPLLFGVGTGMLDAIGARGVAGAVTQKQVMNSFRARALGVLGAAAKGGSVEAGTEAVQGALEQIGIKKGAGETWEQALSKFDWSQVVEGAVQGGIAGMFMGGSGKALSNTFERIAAPKVDVPKVVAEAKANIVPTNEASVEAAADKIEKAINDSGEYKFDRPASMDKPATVTTVPVNTEIKPSPITQTDENSGVYNFGSNVESTVESVPEGSGGPGTDEAVSGEGETVLPGPVQQESGDSGVAFGFQEDTRPEEVVRGANFKLGDQDTFYHASPRKRQGRLIPNDAKNLGKGVYFATDKKSTEDEFGDTNTTEVKLNITNPVEYGSGTPEWQKVQKLALEKYNKDQRSKFKGDPEDFEEQSDLGEIPATYVSDAAVELGHDAITQKNDLYGHEINVLDESKIVYQEDTETPQQKANRELDALAASGDISRDGKKVTILTEKGGREAKRIHEELQKTKSTDSGGSATDSPTGAGTGEQRSPAGDTGSTEKQQGGTVDVDVRPAEDMGSQTTDQEPAAQGGIPTNTPPPTDSVALDQPEDEKVSGIKKALVSDEKIESTPIDRRSTEDMLVRAKDDVDSGRINPKSIVDEIAKGNARALQADEVSALVYYKAQIDKKADSLNQELIDAIGSGDIDTQTQVRAQLDALNQEIDNYHTMSLKTAYEQSLAFRMRQMLLDNEYNLASQILKYKATNNGVITPEVEERFKKLDADLKAANLRIKALEEQQAKSAAENALQVIKADTARQRERRLKAAQSRKQKINDFFNAKKIKSDPNRLNNVFQVVGEGVYNGSLEAMRLAVLAGNDVATVIQAGVDYINEHYRGNDFNESEFDGEFRPAIEKLIPTIDDDGLPMPTVTEDGRLRIPAKLIKAVAEQVENIDELTQEIHKIVKQDFPDITIREVRDAITRYGEIKSLSKDELDTKIREMKRIGRMISSLEDIQDQKRPMRSGLQRDKPTDEERKLMRQIRDGMKDLPIDDADLERQLKTSLDAVKTRLQNQIADLQNQIETGEKTPKKKGIEYDQEANELKQQRDALRSIIQSIEGKPKMSDEQKIRMAMSGVQRTIDELERRISAKDVSPSQKSSAPVTPELTALRERRKQLAETYKQLQDDLGVTEKKRLELHKKALQKAIDGYQQRINEGDFLPPKKKEAVKPDTEAVQLKLERDKIKREFDILQEKVKYANRPMSEKVWDAVIDVWNLPKSFVASVDMSAPFRQGFVLMASNPTAGAKSFQEMFSQAFSEQKANEWMLRLRETDAYAEMKNAKLYLAEPTTKHTAKEEQFVSNLAGKIPVFGPLVKMSERAYTGFLNKLRADVFVNGADRLREQGMTPENSPEAYKALAKFINNATGRGNLGGAETAAHILNGLFFSPRYVASRINLLNPVTYVKMPAPVRKMALKSMAAYIGFNTMLLVIANAAFDDLEVEWDPRSSDFGKFKIGDTRYDPWAGFQQVVRFIAQVVTGERKSTKTGEITKIDGTKFPFETRLDVAMRFIRSKLSPTAGSLVNILQGENMVGEEVTPESEVIKNIIPLYMQDMVGIYEEEGATGVVTSAIPAFFGIGVQSYGLKSGIDEKIDPKNEVQVMNQKHQYSIKQVDRRALAKSLEQEVTDEMHAEYQRAKDQEIKRLFDRYKFRLEDITDRDIYDKNMDAIVKEADRKAKFNLARENKWDTEKFKEGNKFFLRTYVKKNGKVEERKSLFR